MAALGELCEEMRNGIAAKPDQSTGLPILRISAVRPMRLNAGDVRFLPVEFAGTELYALRAGDLLFTRYNGNRDLVGACALVREAPDILVYPDKLIRVRLRTDIAHPAYLEKVIATEESRRFLFDKLKTSAGQVGISGADLKRLHVPLPPLAEQKRIADKLDALMARVDACRERLDRVPGILKGFRDAVLSAAIRGGLTKGWRGDSGSDSGPNLVALSRAAAPDDEQYQDWLGDLPAAWTIERAAEIVAPTTEIVYGIVQPGPKLAVGVPYVRGMDIVDGKIQVDQLLKTSPEIAKRYSRASIQGGDVLLGIIRATKVAVVPDTLNGANITQGTARFRPSERISTKFLAICLEAPETQRWLHAHYRGIDMPGLNLADVRRVPIPMPSSEEQAEIVRRVESLFALADAIEVRYQAARAHVEKLTPALLAKAFRGELVAQDPRDKPAAELLQRLRAQQVKPAASGKTGATRGRKPRAA